jgi:hypothetical protein
VRKLPRKIHNMTAVREIESEQFVAAIYFRREAKTTQVSPVYLNKKEDLETVKKMWDNMRGHGEDVGLHR